MRAGTPWDEQTKPMALFNMLYHDVLDLAVQPIVDLQSGDVVALEILSRAPSGVLAPDELFRLARQYNVLEPLTILVCKKVAEAAPLLTPFVSKGLFLNMEADISKDVVTQCVQMIEMRLPNVPIVIEVTEHVPSSNNWRALAEGLGCHLAMDDLGKGHSNLYELMELRPAFAKICMEIVAGIETSDIKSRLMEAFREVSDHIDAQVIAEGIESYGDLQRLKEMGFPYGQGYFFSKPKKLHEIPIQDWMRGYGDTLRVS